MWFLVLIPLVLTSHESIEPVASYMDLEECRFEAEKLNTGREMLFLHDRYRCRHATAPILRAAKYVQKPR